MRRCLSGSRRPSGCGGWQGYPGSPRRPCAGSGPVGFRCKGRRMGHDAPPVPRGLGSSDPVLRLGSTMSLTNLMETRNRSAAARCVAFLNDINDALTKLHRKWLAHPCPPTSATGRGIHKSNATGILNRDRRNTVSPERNATRLPLAPFPASRCRQKGRAGLLDRAEITDRIARARNPPNLRHQGGQAASGMSLE